MSENPKPFFKAEQIDLFNDGGEPNFEAMSDAELYSAYLRLIGVPFRHDLSRDELIKALKDPDRERSRLREIDRESDKEDLRRPYRGR